jgi:hypothetical protein
VSHRTRRKVVQFDSKTGKPKRPWRSALRLCYDNDGEPCARDWVAEPVSYNAAPGLKRKPKPKRYPMSSQYLDLLSTMTAVRLGIPLSMRGRAILQMFYQSVIHPTKEA